MTLFAVQLMFVYPIRQSKGKIITIIYFLVCFAKGTWLKMRFYTVLFICDLRKILFLTTFNTKFSSPEIIHELQVSG